MFLQLLFAGSQAALCGMAVLLPALAVGADALRTGRVATVLVLGLIASGLMALYPLFVPPFAIAGVLTVTALVILDLRRNGWQHGRAVRAAALLMLFLAVAIFADVVSFSRDVRYWKAVADGAQGFVGLPVYQLGIAVLPGWLTQTRDFYALTSLGHASFGQILLALIVPAVFIGVAAVGLRRYPALRWTLLFIAVACALALYSAQHDHCSYCTDRTLLSVAPLLGALTCCGIAAMLMSRRPATRMIGVLVIVALAVVVGARVRAVRLRFTAGSYFLDTANRAMLAKLPAHAGGIEIEGYDEDPWAAPGEEVMAYDVANERTGGKATIPDDIDDNQANVYFGQQQGRGPVQPRATDISSRACPA